MFVVVFVAKKHASACTVSPSSDSTGYGGILGNKGAVAVRMQLYEIRAVVCLTAAHLSMLRLEMQILHIREHLTFKFRAPVTNVEQLMSVDNRQIGKESYVVFDLLTYLLTHLLTHSLINTHTRIQIRRNDKISRHTILSYPTRHEQRRAHGEMAPERYIRSGYETS